jgi:hypothetical protein
MIEHIYIYIENIHRIIWKPCTHTFSPEPEFLNIYWRLKSRLFKESCLLKGQSGQQGSLWLHFCVCCILKTFLC